MDPLVGNVGEEKRPVVRDRRTFDGRRDDEPPAVLGKMIGGALVGTFLGILIAYGFVSPVASLLEQKAQEGSKIYQVIKVVLLASMSGYAPQVAVEFGRKALAADVRPTFRELEEELKNRKGK